jgi:DNA-binding NarL/FixJ family response regulator
MPRVRILIADDHAVVRRGIRSLLESQPGWQVCGEAVNGRDAVAQAARLRPDVVVMDIAMPELNGLEATRQIAAALPQTEILILTMDDSEEVARQVLRAGARGFVLKSDADCSLTSAVEVLRQHKPFLTPRVTGFVLDKFVQADHIDDNELTPREREVVQLLAEGKSNKEVANTLGVSVRTAEAHRANIMHKLNLGNLSDLVRYAVRNKIVAA